MVEQKKFMLIGAGPGDPDLITMKGIKALKQANVVLYDALIDNKLLDYASNAKLVYVGKRRGQHYATQDEINALIVENITQNACVVRLKGGDPFIFGRAQEEINFVRQAFPNIEIEVIPGISSAIGLPSLHQIPLTQRGTNESVWLLTGTTAKNGLSQDIELAAQSTATVVILMGMHQLNKIIECFLQFRSNNTLVTIIQNGSTENEKIVRGNLLSILQLVEEQQVSSPAIIIIQNVNPNI